MEQCLGSVLNDELAVEHLWVGGLDLQQLTRNTFIAAINLGVLVFKLIQSPLIGFLLLLFCLSFGEIHRQGLLQTFLPLFDAILSLFHVELIPILSSYIDTQEYLKMFSIDQL